MPGKTSTSSPSSPRRFCSGRARLLCPADLPGVSLSAADAGAAVQPRHVHASLTLGLVTAGARRIETAREIAAVRAGEAYALQPGLAHACAPEGGPCAYLAFSLESQALPPGFPASLPLVIRHAGLAEALARLAEAVQGPAGGLERQSLLAEALEILAGLAGPESAAPAQAALDLALDLVVERARDLLERAPEEPVSLPELAARCGAEPFALHRAFTRRLGLPPHAFQTHLRLRRAKELLRAGAGPAEAALAAGFCDQSHLNRHFARLVGQTPAEYAAAQASRRP